MMIENLTKSIIGAVFKVHNTLGPGFLESVYEKSLLIELRNLGIEAKAQEAIKVGYVLVAGVLSSKASFISSRGSEILRV